MGEDSIMAFLFALPALGGAAAAGTAGIGSTLATVFGAIGTALSVAGTLQASSAQAEAAEYNKKVADMQASVARDQAAARAAQIERQNKQRGAAARAAGQSSGFELSGSIMDEVDAVLDNGRMDVLTAMYEGEVQATKATNEAELYRSQARNYRTAGYIGAATKAFAGVADIYRPKSSGALANV